MSLTPGTRVGSFEVTGSLGAGGMGEVYRAHDARLQRDVAIKVLPAAVAQDADRRARFEREARTLASLNHPRIATVHGLEEAGGSFAIVMELVEGPTLATLIARGPMPIAETLEIGAQLADALEAAHEQGIIHRDLKPANVKVRPDGTVKVLDFGLAKALAGTDSAIELANSPTAMPTGRTEAGIILGTAAYMSPEQARGRPVDKRADIWAFGCVLFEMLTGAQAFSGESTTDVLASIVQREPDWSLLPPDLPSGVRALLHRALQKNTRDRLRDIGDARIELAASAAQPPAHAASTPAARPLPPATRDRAIPERRLWPALLAGFAIGALVAAIVVRFAPPSRQEDGSADVAVRSMIMLPAGATIAPGRGSAVALSPDGRQLVYSGQVEKTVRLYLRPLDRFEVTPLAGTEDATNPFFSPDGRWVGFFAGGKLKKVALAGGAPVTLGDARTPRGEAWLPDGSILLTAANNQPVTKVPEAGGASAPFTTIADGEMSHRWPRALAGGAAVLFTVWNDTGWEPARVAVQRNTEREHRTVIEGGGYPRSVHDAATGRTYLIYARSEGLLAAPFDVERLVVTGAPVPILDNVLTNLSGGAHFDVAGGTLAYVPGTMGEADRDLVWLTLDGQATPARRVQHMSQAFSLSPDGTRILRNNTVGARDVWIDDVVRGTSTRVTDSSENFLGVWSPDAQWIVASRGTPIRNMYRRRLAAGAIDEQLTRSPNWQEPRAISFDGTKVVYQEIDPVTGMDLWVLDLPPIDKPLPADGVSGRALVRTNFHETEAELSPDGKWLAYQSNETGRFEIYVRSFPDVGPAQQISGDTGVFPRWSRDGTLYYRTLTGMMMAVRPAPAAATGFDTPRPLFNASSYENWFGVAPDNRLLMMKRYDAELGATAIALVNNVIAELRQRVK